MTSQEESAPLRRGPAPGQAGEPPASTQAGAGSPRRPQPFWPDRSPAFLKLRRAVRALASEDPVLIGLSGGADSLGLVAAALAEGRDVLACVLITDCSRIPRRWRIGRWRWPAAWGLRLGV